MSITTQCEKCNLKEYAPYNMGGNSKFAKNKVSLDHYEDAMERITGSRVNQERMK
jgi:hypothetical protein